MVKLLIVDDEVDLVRNITTFLNLHSGEFEVMTAGSAEEAEQLLQSMEVEILLTDVRLPKRDGIDLLRRASQLRPKSRVVVMTAFPSPDVRRLALQHGAVRFVEKPLDLEELRQILLEVAYKQGGWSGMVGDLEIFDLAQMLVLSGKSKAIQVSFGTEQGVLVFDGGKLVHASTASLEGPEAFFAMASWEAGQFVELTRAKARNYPPNITMPTTHLLLEAARLRDEVRRASQEEGTFSPDRDRPKVAPSAQADLRPFDEKPGRKEGFMGIKDSLGQLQGVEGFIGAAVFSPTGEMLEALNTGNFDIKAVGTYANNALLNAQKASDAMGIGRGNLVQIRAPQATVIMRCLNEATDFVVTAAGKAHFHTVLIMHPEGNVGMALMLLEKAVTQIADQLR